MFWLPRKIKIMSEFLKSMALMWHEINFSWLFCYNLHLNEQKMVGGCARAKQDHWELLSVT